MPEYHPDFPLLSEASAALQEYDCSLQLEEWKIPIPFSFPFLIALLLAEMQFIFFRAAQKVLLFWFVLKTILITQPWELQLLANGACAVPRLSLFLILPVPSTWAGSWWASAWEGTQMAQELLGSWHLCCQASVKSAEALLPGEWLDICLPRGIPCSALPGCAAFASQAKLIHESSPFPCISFPPGRREEWGSVWSAVWLLADANPPYMYIGTLSFQQKFLINIEIT